MKKRLLTLMWLLCPLLFVAGAWADFTVYVKVNTKDQQVNFYFWGVSGASTTWPGMEMTKTTKHNYVTGDDDEVYAYTITGTTATSVSGIFNLGGGSPQTNNLTLNNENVYFWTGTGNVGVTNITSNYTQTTQDFTVNFTDPGWNAVYAYAWSGDSDAKTAAWPGNALTKNGNTYSYTYNGTVAPDKIIFNNGDNGKQTPDMAFVGGKTYTHVYTLVGDPASLFEGAWTTDLPANDMTETSDNVFTLTKENVELSAGTKINYKVTYGHSGWDINFGKDLAVNGTNVELEITESGTYDVTFTLDLNQSTLSAVATPVSLDPTTFYHASFVNNGKWSKVYAYLYDANGTVGTAWPGIKLEESTVAGEYNYEAMLSSEPTNIIFNAGDGGMQTENLTFSNGESYPYEVPTYTVCGTDALGGWGATEGTETNLMTLGDDGVFTWTKTNVEITALHQEYRLQVNKGYTDTGVYAGVAGISGNKVVDLEKTGTYDITITFDQNTKTVSEVFTRHAVDAQDYTVKFVNSGNWSGVNAYTYKTGETDQNAPWPGRAITKLEEQINGFDVYSYTITNVEEDDVPTVIIFNDGTGNQTGNLAFENNKIYYGKDIYGVAGNNTALFGGYWEGDGFVNVLNNTMTDNGDGTYTWSKNNVELPAGTIVWRIGVNGDWANKGIGGVDGNKEFNIAEAGTYNVTFTLDTNEGEGHHYADVTVTPATATVTYDYYVAGASELGLEWSAQETNKMTEGTDGKFTLTKTDITLAKGNYSYKVIQTRTTDGQETWLPDGMGNDKVIEITEAGTYDITWTLDPTMVGTETYPYSHEVTLKQSSTIVPPTKVQIGGSFNNWAASPVLTADTSTGNYVYTLDVDLTGNTEDQNFKIIVNDGGDESNQWAGWIGWEENRGLETIDAPEGWLYGTEDIYLKNSETGYQKYRITATWTPSNDPFANWALKVEGTEAREAVADKYMVVGSYDGLYPNEDSLFGWCWSTDETKVSDNWLTTDDNVTYTWTKNDFDLEANKTISFKVILNGKYADQGGAEYPSENYDYSVTEAGTYDITITFNAETKAVNITAIKQGETFEPAVYSIVGKVEGNTDATTAIFTTEWNPTVATNVMEGDVDNIVYTIVRRGVTLYNGNTIALKVVKDQKWQSEGGVEYPSANEGDNVNTPISEDGIYTVTITFNAQTKAITVTPEKTGDIPQPDKDKVVYYVDMQNWAPSAHIWNEAGALTPDWTVGEYERTLSAFGNSYNVNKYEFAGEPTNIMFQGEDDSKKTSDLPFVNGATYGNEGDGANGVFVFTDDEFQFKPTENINVTANAKYVRQFTVGQPCTVVLPFAIGADKVGDNADAGQIGVFYRVTSVSDGNLNGNTEVPAPYQPYVFIPVVEYPFTFVGVGQFPAVPETKNYAINGGDAFFEFVTTMTVVNSDDEWTYYGWDKETHKFTKAAVGQANPFRSYLKIKTSALGSLGLSAKESIGLNFYNEQGGETTGISNLRAAIEDGTATVYDLQGRRVDNPTMRGIYIVNGKKYVVK